MATTGWRWLDRRVAAFVAVLATAALAASVALSGPDARAPVRDPDAARAVVALMRAGEEGEYVVEYRFERILPDSARLPATVWEARGPGAVVTRSGTSLAVDVDDDGYDCEIVGDDARCLAREPARGLPLSDVLWAAVDAGAYGVEEIAGAEIAGETARCFRVVAHVLNEQLQLLGAISEFCLAPDGLPLRTRRYADHLDEREAVGVVRRFDDESLAPLLEGFEQTEAAGRR